MKYLKLFENHIGEVANEDKVAEICKKYNIRNWTLNSDGTIDVDGNVYLNYRDLNKLPLNFGRVEGYFWCEFNHLKSLEGCPRYLGGDFRCGYNNILSFEGIGYIGGYFQCVGNPFFYFWYLFQDKSKIDMFNEWGVIQNDKVILYRLNDFLQEIGEDNVARSQLNLIKNTMK